MVVACRTRPPCSRSERSEASVAARGAGYQVKRARVISVGTIVGAKLLPFQSEDKIVDVIVLHLQCEGVIT